MRKTADYPEIIKENKNGTLPTASQISSSFIYNINREAGSVISNFIDFIIMRQSGSKDINFYLNKTGKKVFL